MSKRQFGEYLEDTDKKGRGPNIPPDWKRYIMVRAVMESYIPRMLLADQILEQMRQSRDVRDKLPERESIERDISKARNHPESPLDELFSLASLGKYDIPPEAMPAVMSAYKKTLAGNGELTIREAQWIARLHTIIDPPDTVWDWAWAYALEEWLSEITNKPFDTTILDLELISNPHYAQEKRRNLEREITVWRIAEKYGTDPVKLKDLNLSIQETEEIAKSGNFREEAHHERAHSRQRKP